MRRQEEKDIGYFPEFVDCLLGAPWCRKIMEDPDKSSFVCRWLKDVDAIAKIRSGMSVC